MPLVGQPQSPAQCELDKVWRMREDVVNSFTGSAGHRELSAAAAHPAGFGFPDRSYAADSSVGGGTPTAATSHRTTRHRTQGLFASEAERELRALQDAFRQRKEAERSLAHSMLERQRESPSRAHRVRPILTGTAVVATPPPPPPAPTPAPATPAAAANATPGSPQPSPLKEAPKPHQSATPGGRPPGGAAAGGEARTPGKGAGRKPHPKPAWDPVFATHGVDQSVSLLEESGFSPSSTKKPEKERAVFHKDLYDRGQAFQGKRDTELERKAQDGLREAAPHTPYITPYAKELRQDNKRDDKVLGEYYYKKGLEHKTKRSRTLERKRAEVEADLGMKPRPTISDRAHELREPNKTPASIGKYMYDNGVRFQKAKERNNAQKTKEVHAGDNCTFKPEITEKTRVLATSAEARQAGMVGNAFRKTGRLGGTGGPSAPEARLYDRGLMFTYAKEQGLEKKRQEKEQEEVSGVTHTPALNGRSRRLASRRGRSGSRGRGGGGGGGRPRSPITPPGYGYPSLDFTFERPERLSGGLEGVDLERTYAAAEAAAAAAAPQGGEGVQQGGGWAGAGEGSPGGGSAGGMYPEDLLLPPNLDQILTDVRLRQDMRRMGV